MEIKAPAKINLFLNVGQRRSDGFHDIYSIMVKVSLFDTLIFHEAENISIEGPDWLPQEENIAYKAAVLLKNFCGCAKGCRIVLEKEIPAGRGLGGGSSDAAAVLKGLNSFWNLGLTGPELEKLGAELGSDVNFFFNRGAAIAAGRGEIIIPVDEADIPARKVMLIDPGIHVPTRNIYENYTGNVLYEKKALDGIIAQYISGSWESLLKNDLEKTVFRLYPVIRALKERLTNWGMPSLLSGSGSSVFALVDDASKAAAAAKIIEENFEFRVWTVDIIS